MYLPTEVPLGVMSSGGRGDLRRMLRILEELEEVVIVGAVGARAIPSMVIDWGHTKFPRVSRLTSQVTLV